MMKFVVLLLVALCFVFAQSAPAMDDMDMDMDKLMYPSWKPQFFMPEPICAYKCGFKCFRMGFMGGSCSNSLCSCDGLSYPKYGNRYM